jgi:hypothetical protein
MPGRTIIGHADLPLQACTQSDDLGDVGAGAARPETLSATMSCTEGESGSADVKRRATQLLRDATRTQLAPVGVQQMSRSPLRWTVDWAGG